MTSAEQNLYRKIPFTDYKELKKHIAELNRQEQPQIIRYDISLRSGIAAERIKNSEIPTNPTAKRTKFYGVVLRIVEPQNPGELKQIYVDLCLPHTPQIEHPDYFHESNAEFNINNYRSILFTANSLEEERSFPPVRGGICEVEVGPSFPDLFEAANKFIRMIRNDIVFTAALNIKNIISQPQVNSSNVSSQDNKLWTPLDNIKRGRRQIRNPDSDDIRKYGSKSALLLAELEQNFSNKIRKFIDLYQQTYPGIKVYMNDAFRTHIDQEFEFAKGRTAPGKIVTNARGGESAHNFRMGVDFYFMPGAYNDVQNFLNMKDIASQIPGILWGGTFGDKPHIEDKRWKAYKASVKGKIL